MLLHSSTVSAPNESKKSQRKSCSKLVMFFWILRGTTILPDEVHSKDFIDLNKSFNMHGKSLKFLMNHETRQVSRAF